MSEDLWQYQASTPDQQQAMVAQMMAQGTRTFHALHREPGPGEADGPEVALNQAGVLSMSSISPLTSHPLVQESAVDCTAVSGLVCPDSPSSDDSGRLPQRPDRRIIIRPAHVPALDFTRLRHQLDDEEEEEEEQVRDELVDGHDLDGEEGLEDDDELDDGHEEMSERHEYRAYARRDAGFHSGSEDGYMPRGLHGEAMLRDPDGEGSQD